MTVITVIQDIRRFVCYLTMHSLECTEIGRARRTSQLSASSSDGIAEQGAEKYAKTCDSQRAAIAVEAWQDRLGIFLPGDQVEPRYIGRSHVTGWPLEPLRSTFEMRMASTQILAATDADANPDPTACPGLDPKPELGTCMGALF